MNIVFLDCSTVGSTSLKPLEAQGNFSCYQYTQPEETVQRLQGIDVAIVNKTKITKEVIDACPQLKLICVAATGMNNIDLEYAAQKNITVKNVADYSTNSVAQVTFALVLELINKTACFDTYVKSGSYSSGTIFSYLGEEFSELSGKRYGIIGMGNIGKKVAAIATTFGCEVVYYSTTGKNNSAHEYKRVELDELLANREKINLELQTTIDHQTDPWGVKVSSVEVKHIDLPQEMQRAMARQAEAERDRRAKVINADGEYEAATKLSEASEIMNRNPVTLQLRYLQTLVDISSKGSSTIIPLTLDLLGALPGMKK